MPNQRVPKEKPTQMQRQRQMQMQRPKTFMQELDNANLLIDELINILYQYYIYIDKTIKINNIKYNVLDTISIKIGSEFKNDNIIICLLYGHKLIVGVDSPYVFMEKDYDRDFNSTVVLPEKIKFE